CRRGDLQAYRRMWELSSSSNARTMKTNAAANIQTLLPHPRQIVSDLRDATLHEYRHAIDHYVQRIQQIPGVLYIGQFGTIRTPGVSDIDLLILCSDSAFLWVCQASSEIICEIPNGSY